MCLQHLIYLPIYIFIISIKRMLKRSFKEQLKKNKK